MDQSPPDVGAPSNDRFRLGYRPSLDGLRGVAILLVMLFHFHTPAVGGFIGVDVFFVLSGLLISILLCEEVERTGRLDFLAFYRRRLLRLLPALIAVIVILVGVTSIVRSPHRDQAIRESLMAFFYSLNWFKAYGLVPENNYLGHTWSLAIEEQFYLLWPLILVGLLRARLRKGVVLALVAAGLAASAAMRSWHWLTYGDAARVYHGLDSRADSLLTGCLLGLALFWRPGSGTRPRWLSLAGGMGLAALLVLSVVPFGQGFYFLAGIPLVNLSAAAILGSLLVGPSLGALRGFLELRILVWIGRLSYGLYLWHCLVPHLLIKLRLSGKPWTFLLEAALSFALAAVSFYALEIHFLKRKRTVAALPHPAGSGPQD